MRKNLFVLALACVPAAAVPLVIDTCDIYKVEDGALKCKVPSPTPTPTPTPTPVPTPTPTPVPTPTPTPSLCGTSANQLDSGILSNISYTLNMDTQAGLNFVWPLNRGQSISVQITTGAAGRAGNFIMEAASQVGQSVDKFMNISTTRCDFSYAQVDSGMRCGDSVAAGALRYQVEAVESPGNYCSLRPNTTYYLNMRNEAAHYPSARGIDTCPVNAQGGGCGLLFQFH